MRRKEAASDYASGYDPQEKSTSYDNSFRNPDGPAPPPDDDRPPEKIIYDEIVELSKKFASFDEARRLGEEKEEGQELPGLEILDPNFSPRKHKGSDNDKGKS